MAIPLHFSVSTFSKCWVMMIKHEKAIALLRHFLKKKSVSVLAKIGKIINKIQVSENVS
jgi:hypothetical protein